LTWFWRPQNIQWATKSKKKEGRTNTDYETQLRRRKGSSERKRLRLICDVTNGFSKSFSIPNQRQKEHGFNPSSSSPCSIEEIPSAYLSLSMSHSSFFCTQLHIQQSVRVNPVSRGWFSPRSARFFITLSSSFESNMPSPFLSNTWNITSTCGLLYVHLMYEWNQERVLWRTCNGVRATLDTTCTARLKSVLFTLPPFVYNLTARAISSRCSKALLKACVCCERMNATSFQWISTANWSKVMTPVYPALVSELTRLIYCGTFIMRIFWSTWHFVRVKKPKFLIPQQGEHTKRQPCQSCEDSCPLFMAIYIHKI
jgi:hypothetical protein